MRIKIILLCASAVALAGSLLIASSASDATTAKVDLSITGGTVTGFTRAGAEQELPVVFTMRNHSQTTSVSVDFFFTLTNATADGTDYVCPQSDHVLTGPDGPSCEPGYLAAGRTTRAAIMVTPTISSGMVSVKACANDESGNPDPVPSNDCKTVQIRIG
jgi:hypothetical protein